MQQVNEAYKLAALQPTRQTRAKLVVDGVEYIDELISHPLISISSDSLIGGFPAKTVSFEMRRVDGLSLAGKEFSVYRGLSVDGEYEYVLQGIFKALPEDITINDNGSKISVSAYDRAVEFDIVQTAQPKLTADFTYGDYIDFILSDMGIVLANTDYPLKNTVMTSLPNADEGVTKRTLLAKFAEIIGCICTVDRNGNLYFSKQQETDYKISDYYGRFLVSEDIRTVNQISVATQSDIADDVFYPEAVDNPVTYRITENPFCSPEQTELIKLISENIIGLKTGNYTVEDIVDDYIIDVNDIVTIIGKDNSAYNLPIMSYSSTGRIKATVKAELSEQEQPALERSLSSKVRSAEIKIDRQNTEIKSKVSKDSLASEISQTPDTIYLSSGNGNGKVVVEGENFGVDEDGKMHCNYAVISGTVTATSGKIGSWDITHDGSQCLWYEGETYAMQLGDYGQTGISGYKVLKSNSEYDELWYIRASGAAYFPKSSSERFQCEGYTNSSGVTYDTLLISRSGAYIIGEPDSTTCVYFGTSSGLSAKDTAIRGSNVRLYAFSGGGVYLGSSGSTAVTSDENLKHLYSIDERYEKFFDNLEPLLYTYKQGGHRKHIGYGARKVKEALINADLSTEEFAGVVVQKDITIYADENGTGEDITYDELYSLRYEEFIALNTFMIQKLLKRIDSLERKVEALEAKLNDNT